MTAPCGSVAKYWRGCRCDDCRAANTAYAHELAARHAERGGRCAAPDCDGGVYANGWCANCYARARRNGRPARIRPRRAATCKADGCDEVHYANGYCRRCGARAKRNNGDPRRRLGGSAAERLERYTRRDPDTGCLLWTATTGHGGHGYWRQNGRRIAAHRAAWELANGRPLRAGYVVRHRCDRPACCEPSHLVEGTQAENIADMRERRRAHYQRTREDVQLALFVA